MAITKHDPLSHLHVFRYIWISYHIPWYYTHTHVHVNLGSSLVYNLLSLCKVLTRMIPVGWRLIISIATFFDATLILFSFPIGIFSLGVFSTCMFPLCWVMFFAG